MPNKEEECGSSNCNILNHAIFKRSVVVRFILGCYCHGKPMVEIEAMNKIK